MLGLKLWSTNDFYIQIAQELYNKSVYDYIELFVFPGSIKYLKQWEALNIPYVLHAPHSYTGLNLSNCELVKKKQNLLCEVNEYFEKLNPHYVIFHPGVNGNLETTIEQLKYYSNIFPDLFKFSLIENMPAVGVNLENCVGSTVSEISEILDKTSLGFCFDIGHAICSAVTNKKDVWDQIYAFLKLKPKMFHLSDGKENSEKDKHLNLGKGDYDLQRISRLIGGDKCITIETDKRCRANLNDFKDDCEYLKELINE